MRIRFWSQLIDFFVAMARERKATVVSHALVPSARRGGAIRSRNNHPRGDGKAKSRKNLSNFPFYKVIFLERSCSLYGKLARKGTLPLLATPLFCFESAQQLKRPHREWQGSLPQLATLSILTRVKLDSSGGRVKGSKVVRPAASTPGRPMGIRPQDAAMGLHAGEPTQLT